MGYKSQLTITRPANVTAYAANDVVGGAFQLTGLPNAILLQILSATLRIPAAAVPSGMTSFRLHLYSANPASALADNAPWDLPAGDRAAYEGYADLGTVADVGASLFSKLDQASVVQTGSGLWGYLVTVGGFTPGAVSEAYVLTLYGKEF